MVWGGVASVRAKVRAGFPPIEWRRVESVWACDRCWASTEFYPLPLYLENSFIRVELRARAVGSGSVDCV